MRGKIDVKLRDIIGTYPTAKMEVIVEASTDSESLDSLVGSRNAEVLGQALQYTAVRIEACRIKELAGENRIARIWYVDPRIFEPYFNVLKAVKYILSLPRAKRPMVVNMSLGPPIDTPGALRFDPDEPFNAATKILCEAGIIVVLPVGNDGTMGNDTLNPWSVAPWVIGVGAATKDGKTLADFSSRGKPRGRLYRPTVVAPGIDVITTHPKGASKTPEQFLKDRQFISPDKLDLYTVASGTSMAAADISGAIKNILGFMIKNGLMNENIEYKKFGNVTAELMKIGNATVASIRPLKRVEVKFAVGNYDKAIQLEFWPSSTLPSNMKKLLIKCAMPMPGYGPHEVGAGFISNAIVRKVFGDYNLEIMPIKIM